jgi:hypothetical protein
MATAPLSAHRLPSVHPSQGSQADLDAIVLPRSVYDRVLARLNRVYAHRPSREILWIVSKLQNHGDAERDE